MLEDEIVRHRKKKPSSTSKSSARSTHKHIYLPGIFEHTETYAIPNKPARMVLFRDRGFYCKDCGKLKGVYSILSTKSVEQFDTKYPDARVFVVEDYYHTEFVEV